MILEVFSAAFHYLRRNLGVTLLAVVLLGSSVAAVATAFALASAVTLAESPFPSIDRLWAPRLAVLLPSGAEAQPALFSYPDVAAFRRHQETFDAVGAYASLELPLVGEPGPEQVRGEFVDADYFVALDARAAAGSLLAGQGAGGDVAFRGEVLLSHRLWQSRFQGDPSVVGQPIEIFGVPLQILGVLAPEFEGLDSEVDLWLDMGSLPKIADYPDILTDTGYARFQVVARSRPEVAEAAVVAAVTRAGRAVAAERPEVPWGEATVQSLAAARSDPGLRRFLGLLLAAAGLVLLIACFNVAGLHLSRAAARAQNFAVRKALGASPGRILAQVFTETGLVVLAGTAVGLAGTSALLRYVVTVLRTDWVWESTGPDIARLMAAGISPGVVGFAVAIAFLATLAAGIVPALDVLRRDGVHYLREGAGQIVGGSGGLRSLGQRGLVIAQAAVAVALLAVAGVLFRDLAEMLRIEPGFDEQSVQALRITSSTLYGPAEAPAFHQRLIAEVEGLPGVASAAIGSCVPLSCRWQSTVQAAEDDDFDPLSAPLVGTHFVSPQYFRTLGISLLAGRAFTAADTRETSRVVVVSRSLADRLWPARNALGRRLKIGENGDPATVIGIVADARQRSLFEAEENVYIADYQNGAAWGILLVKAERDGPLDAATLRETLQGVDAGLPFQPAGSLEEQLARVSSGSRYTSRMVLAVAALALLLTVLGVYGVAALAVAARFRELALRLVFGADRRRLLRHVLSHGLRPVAVGIALGAPVAWAVSRSLTLSVVDGQGTLLAAYLGAAAVVAVAALLAILPSVRRTLSIEPSVALRRGP
ncbi:MAG: ABC transporter permease [Acidobacteriota bacterium]